MLAIAAELPPEVRFRSPFQLACPGSLRAHVDELAPVQPEGQGAGLGFLGGPVQVPGGLLASLPSGLS